MRYYLCEQKTWAESVGLFDSRDGSHYVDLPDGKILVCASFRDAAAQSKWESHPNVSALPDPAFEGTASLNAPEHVSLRHLFGDQQKKSSPSSADYSQKTVLDVAREVGKIHPLMKLRSR